ncbi:MAG: crossover junction endodeoxyribonuclease RuvC [Candidatus Nanoarchaeia archaeon]|jgi:crossover junction endodeoxyribonuclease RuvC|nr:crossover junction endodeoxyribonuclease RuvC [Candidatus Nanoarchaeia archaeon]
MIAAGCDVSTQSTGWSIVEKTDQTLKIIDKGLIRGEGSMSTIQRLYLLGNELKKVFDKYNPDEIGIEESLFMRGPTILRTLSRFSGVAIYQAYAHNKKEPLLFGPPEWRKIVGIAGNCSKAEVQVSVCERFGLLTQKQITTYQDCFKKIVLDVSNAKAVAKQQKTTKKTLAKQIKEIEKAYDKISTDIYSDSGINNDIADSISIALAVLFKKNEVR